MSCENMGDDPSPGVLAHCGKAPPPTHSLPAPRPAQSLPRSQWPFLARTLYFARHATEQGVGDTLARLLDSFGGKTIAEMYATITGRDCGCANRQVALNSLYPYTKEAP